MSEMKEKQVLRWIYSVSKKYLLFVGLLVIFSAVISGSFILLALVSSRLLDTVTGSYSGNYKFLLFALIGIILLQVTFNIISSNVRVRVMTKIEMSMREHLFAHILQKSYLDVTKYHSGELLNRYTSDIGIVVSGVVGIIPEAISIGTKLIFGLTALFFIDGMFTVIILVLGLIISYSFHIFSKRFRYLHKEVQKTSGIVRSFLQECIENIQVIKSFSNERVIQEKLEGYHFDNYKIIVKRNTISNIANMMIYLIFTAGYYFALSIGAFQIANGNLTFGNLTAFLQIIGQIRSPFQKISGIIPQYYSMLASAERLIELELIENEKKDSVIRCPKALYQEMKAIVVDNITFSYDEEIILYNASVRIEKGGVVAIVGPSGIGKSTLIKLLLGLIRCERGDLYFETDDGKIDIDAGTREMFAYVPQGNFILSGTIRDNLLFANDMVSDEKIKKAAMIACIWDVIEDLPDCLDSTLSERGIGLSEGQIQRLAIARAILSNAPILLLDECTSSLDEKTEEQVLNNLKMMKEKTIIMISHHKNAVKCCNQIIRIDNKRFI